MKDRKAWLQSMELQRAGHPLATEQQQQQHDGKHMLYYISPNP